MDQRQLNDKNAVNAAVTLWNNVFRPRLLCRLKSTITAVKFRLTICCPQWRSMLHTFQSNLKRWIFNRVLVSEACVFLLMAGWEVNCSLWKARRLTKWELLIKLRMTAFPVWLKYGEYSKLTTDSDCFCFHLCVRVWFAWFTVCVRDRRSAAWRISE